MSPQDLTRLAHAQRTYLVDVRRHLHQHPELSFQERETAAFVAAELRRCGLEPAEGFGGGHGVVVDLIGGRPGPTLALRADMDALPITEQNDLPFRSQNPGVMHACGHDAHTAVLLATARALSELRDQIPGRVRFLFQPAEELPPGGALGMIEAGCLEGVDAVFGLHQSTALDAGRMSFAHGVRQASTDTIRLSVLGRGGHAAWPQRGVDAIQIAAQVISALHQIVSRRVAPEAPAVLTLGTVHGGTKENIIADEVRITGTVRTLDPATRDRIPKEVESVVKGITEAWGGGYHLDYDSGYPVLVNDPAMAVLAERAATLALGGENVRPPGPPVMAGEDFARFLEHIPGCFGSLGAGTPDSDTRPPAHSSDFMLDESGLPAGVAWYLSLVMNFEALRDA